jgi:hypothetical protein
MVSATCSREQREQGARMRGAIMSRRLQGQHEGSQVGQLWPQKSHGATARFLVPSCGTPVARLIDSSGGAAQKQRGCARHPPACGELTRGRRGDRRPMSLLSPAVAGGGVPGMPCARGNPLRKQYAAPAPTAWHGFGLLLSGRQTGGAGGGQATPQAVCALPAALGPRAQPGSATWRVSTRVRPRLYVRGQ